MKINAGKAFPHSNLDQSISMAECPLDYRSACVLSVAGPYTYYGCLAEGVIDENDDDPEVADCRNTHIFNTGLRLFDLRNVITGCCRTNKCTTNVGDVVGDVDAGDAKHVTMSVA